MKVFVDVGAFEGEGVIAAKEYGFDVIHAIEPQLEYFLNLEEIEGVRCHNCALSDMDGERTLYHAGTASATLWPEKYVAHASSKTETCEVIGAERWFRENTNAEDDVFVKLNCEAAEVPILLSMLPIIDRCVRVFVQYDCLKIPGGYDQMKRVVTAYNSENKAHKLIDYTFFNGTISELVHDAFKGLNCGKKA